jgi:hypothetical protein
MKAVNIRSSFQTNLAFYIRLHSYEGNIIKVYVCYFKQLVFFRVGISQALTEVITQVPAYHTCMYTVESCPGAVKVVHIIISITYTALLT